MKECTQNLGSALKCISKNYKSERDLLKIVELNLKCIERERTKLLQYKPVILKNALRIIKSKEENYFNVVMMHLKEF